MPSPSLRSLIGTAGPKIGTFLFEFATPGIGQILKAAGADYLVLDMEHTGFGFDRVREVVRYCQAAELPLIVRVPGKIGLDEGQTIGLDWDSDHEHFFDTATGKRLS